VAKGKNVLVAASQQDGVELHSSVSVGLSLYTFAAGGSSEEPTHPTDFLNHSNNVPSPKQSIKIITTGTKL